MVRKLIILAIICLLSLHICTASAQDYGAFFATPLECAQSFVFCLQQGNLTGVLSAFDSRIRADMIKTSTAIHHFEAVSLLAGIGLPDEFGDLRYLSFEGKNATTIKTMLQVLLIPDRSVQNQIGSRYSFQKEEPIELTIEQYLDYVQKSNLSRIKLLEVYGIDWSKLKVKDSRFSTSLLLDNVPDDYEEVMLILGVDERTYLCGLTLYHYPQGWKINSTGAFYGGCSKDTELLNQPTTEYMNERWYRIW